MILAKRILTSFLLLIFGLFLTSPVFAVDKTSNNLVIIGIGLVDTCATNIYCDKVATDIYQCYKSPAVLSSVRTTIHSTTIGNPKDSSNMDECTIASIEARVFLTEKLSLYTGPDTFIYPFVRIVKIQV